MFRVPSSTILFRPDSGCPGGSDASVSESVRTPSDSDDANDVHSLAKVEANLKKRDELEREYRKRLAARRIKSGDRQLHLQSHVRREGGRKKHKWSSVKVTPSEKSADEQVQIQAADTTPPTPQKPKTWADLLRNKNLEEQRKMAVQHPAIGEQSGKNIRLVRRFSMTQIVSKDAKDRVDATYVDPIHISDLSMQFSNPHAVSPVLHSATSTFHHAAGASKADQGRYVPPYLRRKMKTSSMPGVPFAADNQAVTASTAQKEQEKRSVEQLTQALKALLAKGFAEREPEHEETAGVKLSSKNKQRGSRRRSAPQATICNTSSPEIVPNTRNAITAEQSEPRSQHTKREFEALRKFPSLEAEKKATTSQTLDVNGAHFGLTQSRVRKLESQQEDGSCNRDDCAGSKPCKVHSQSSTTSSCGYWGTLRACGACTDCIHQQVNAAAFVDDTCRQDDYFANADGPASGITNNDEPIWAFDSLNNGSKCADDSEDVAVDRPSSGSVNENYLERRMLEDFPNDRSTLSQSPTPATVTSASIPAGQEARQDQYACVRHDENCWCKSCCPSLYGSDSSKTNNEDLGAKGLQAENSEPLNCCNCLTTFDSQPGVADCPECDESSGLYTHNAASPDVTEEILQTVLESAIAEERAPEYLTPPRKSREPNPGRFGDTLKHAWEVLELQRYKSVDLTTLQRNLSNVMERSSNYGEAAAAFATVVKHQDETGCWDSRLCWADDDEKKLLRYVVDGQLIDHGWLAVDLCTSKKDCLQRWEEIKLREKPSAEASTTSTANESPKTTYPDGWNAELDERLLNLSINRQIFNTIATELGKSTTSCRLRFKQINPQGWKPKSLKQIKKGASKTVWTPQLDRNLMSLKESYNTWSDIHEVLDMTVEECKARFKEIAPKGWKPKSKKGNKNSPVMDSAPSGAEDKVRDIRADIEYGPGGSAEDCAGDVTSSNVDNDKSTVRYQDCGCKVGVWCFCDGSIPTAAEASRTAADTSEQHARFVAHNCPQYRCGYQSIPTDHTDAASKNTQDTAGWGDAAENGESWGNAAVEPSLVLCQNCGFVTYSPCTCSFAPHPSVGKWGCATWTEKECPPESHLPEFDPWDGSGINTTHQPEPASHTPYTVTYWATVESGGKEIHIPIDSKNVCGPEKTVVDGGMQKVWKWVHDKGLNDKIGLQNAFDLAQAMHEGEQVEEVETAKVGPRAMSVARSGSSCRSYEWGF